MPHKPPRRARARTVRGTLAPSTVNRAAAANAERIRPRRVRSLQKFLKAYGPGAEGKRLRESFARRIDTSHEYLVALAWGYRTASPSMAIKIEGATHGLVTREDLRPDTDWASFAPRGEQQAVAA